MKHSPARADQEMNEKLIMRMPPHISYEQHMRNRRYLQRSVSSAYGGGGSIAGAGSGGIVGAGGGPLGAPSHLTSDLGSNYSQIGDYPYYSSNPATRATGKSSQYHSTNFVNTRKFKFVAGSGWTSGGNYPQN